MYLVLQSMSTPLHMHILGIRIIEFALAQFTVETDDLSCGITLDLLNVLMA